MKRGKKKQSDRPATNKRGHTKKRRTSVSQMWFPWYGDQNKQNGPYAAGDDSEDAAGRGRGRKKGGA